MKITVFSHFFRVDEFEKRAYFDIVRPFAFQYTEYDYRLVMIARRRREPPPKPTIKKIYASFYNNKRVFHFHRNTLEDFMGALKSKGYEDYEIEYVDLYTPTKIDLKVLPRYVSKDNQVPLIDYLVADGTMKMLNLQTGQGKELKNSEKILTPNGWTTHGEISVGEQVVCPDGTIANVTGVFPQGLKDVYRIYFEDGRCIDAGAEHLWKVYCDDGLPSKHWRVVNTLEMMGLLNTTSSGVYIPLIEPYGGFDNVSLDLNSLEKMLTSLNLNGEDHAEVEIPEEYLHGSVEIKIALLKGLLAKTWLSSNNGKLIFTTTSKKLAKQVQELVWSLGGVATLTPHQKYAISDGKFVPDILTYKVNVRIKNSDKLKLGVSRIDKLPQKELMTCISIDHKDHLYITTNYVVTHNTYCALKAASIIGGRVVVSIPTRFFNLWLEALGEGEKQVLDLKAEDVLFVQGGKDLRSLMDMAINDQLTGIKVIVIASRTMELYIEAYERTNGDLDGLYPLDPNQFYPILDIATRIKDELHLNLATNYKEELHLHCPKSISLSATLEDGSFRDKIFKIMFPKEMRSPETEYLKYIDVVALMYKLKDKDKVRYTHRGSNDYNHIAYEQYILKNRSVWHGYYRIVKEWVQKAYLDLRQPGMRAAIFADSVEMATEIMTALKSSYPDVDIRRYAASTGDDYHYARDADILVTTVKSFGTGFDVENLFVVLMTTALRSQNTNIQVLGRLRLLKNYIGISPVFYYLTCVDISKHMSYHDAKKTQFYGKVQSHSVRFLNNEI